MSGRTLTSSLVVRLVDQATRPARGISNSLLGIQQAGMKAGQVSFGDRLTAGLRRNDAALTKARGGIVDAVAGYYTLRNAIAAPVREAMLFQSAMADVRKVVDFPTPKSFSDFRNGLMALSKEVPISVNGLAAIAAAAGQAGIAGDDLNRFTKTAAKVGVAFDISADQAGEAMAKLMTGLGLTIDEVTLLSDAMNHLSNSQASSAAEILDVVRRVGAQGKQFGFSATEVAAFGSAMIASGAQSDVAATSFRNMGKALTAGDSATKRVRNGLKAIGLDAKTVARRMQEDAVGTTLDVLERISKMPKEMQAALSTDIFGSEARALGPLLTNLELVRDSLGLVDDASKYAGSSFKEFEVRAGTFENAVQIFNNRLSAMKVVIGAALIPAINRLMGALEPVIETVTAFAQAHPELVSNVLAAVASVIAFKVAVSGLKFAGLLGRGGALSMLAFGMNTVGKASARLWAAAAANVAYQGSLKSMAGGGALTKIQRLGAAVRGLAFGIPGVAGLSGVFGLLAKAATAVGARIAGVSAPVWAAIAVAVAAVAAAGYSLWKYWDRISSVFSGVARRIGEELSPALELIKPVLEAISPATDAVGAAFQSMQDVVGGVIQWIKSKWGEFKTWIGGFFSREVLSDSDKAAFEQSGYEMADAMVASIKSVINDLVSWFAGIPQRILDAIGSINLGGLIKWPEPPQWWQQLFGSDDVDTASAPPPSAMDYEGFDTLSGDQKNATRILEQDAAAGNLPTPQALSELESHAGNLRAEISAIRSEIDALVDGPMKNAIVQGKQPELDQLQADLQEIEGELEIGRVRADELTWALGVVSETEATPEISTASIDAALRKVRELASELRSVSKGSVPGSSSVPIDGKRERGGPVEAGGTYLVGEKGPELVRFGASGFVHNARQTMAMLRGFASNSNGKGPSNAVPSLHNLISRSENTVAATVRPGPSTGGSRPAPTSIEFSGPLIGSLTVHQGRDPMAIVEQLGEAFEQKISAIMRGLHADYGGT
jgi:TP901 family phage tail tape measure protein